MLLGRVAGPGEPLWLPEDRAKLHALWSWRAEQCGKCRQRRAEWFDERGQELRDPPFEIAESFCPACEFMHDWEHDDGKKDRRPGTYPYYRRVDDDPEDVAG